MTNFTARLLDQVSRSDSGKLLKDYLSDDNIDGLEPRSGQLFEKFQEAENKPFEVTPSDLLSITQLSMRIGGPQSISDVGVVNLFRNENRTAISQHLKKIDPNLTNFFLLNQQFITIRNDLGQKIEHPVACYVKEKISKLNFTHYFGLSKMEIGVAFLGPYYYLTDFDNALYSINDEKKGLLRFAVFLGKMLVKLNYPEDPIDNSDLKREKLKGSIKEQLMMRITDYNGVWADNYDSCFIGKIKLDNGDILGNTPVFVVKNYEQHFSLTYHYINNENTDII